MRCWRRCHSKLKASRIATHTSALWVRAVQVIEQEREAAGLLVACVRSGTCHDGAGDDRHGCPAPPPAELHGWFAARPSGCGWLLSGSAERSIRTTARATKTIESTKWACTAMGFKFVHTTIAAENALSRDAGDESCRQHEQSRRRGRRTHAPSAARTTARPTTNVNIRLICSIAEC